VTSTYEVTFAISVSGLGGRSLTVTVAAPSLEDAIAQAKTQVVVFTVTQARIVP
jgi:hypothetical protein